jgi:hypothetical protein
MIFTIHHELQKHFRQNAIHHELQKHFRQNAMEFNVIMVWTKNITVV